MRGIIDMAEKKNSSFEESLKELEGVVRALESGDVTLDEMLALFERGISLTKNCTEILDKAEQKINILVKDSRGEMVEKPFAAER